MVLDAREVEARAGESMLVEPHPVASSWHRLGALVRKEFVQIRRDRRTLGLIMFVPVTLMIIFGYAASFEVQHIRAEFIGNGSPAVRAALTAQGAFEVVPAVARDAATARDDIKHGRTTVAITIDSTGRPAAVMIDGSGLLEAMTVQRSLAALQIRSSGQAPIPVDVLYNPSLKSANFMVPGLVGQIMVQVAMVLTAVGIVRERERGTIEQLMITPISKLELMIGKTVPYLAIAFVDLAVVIVLGRVLFGVPVRGSLLLLIVESLLFLTASMGVGLLISTAAQTQQQAMQMAVFIQLPQMLLSGLVFPIASMPWGVRWISYLFPLTYFLPITRGIFLKGIGIAEVWPETMVLAVMAVLFVSLAAVRFKKTLD